MREEEKKVGGGRPRQSGLKGARADGTAIGVGGGLARAGVRFLPEARKT